jgi:hypothetical protein
MMEGPLTLSPSDGDRVHRDERIFLEPSGREVGAPSRGRRDSEDQGRDKRFHKHPAEERDGFVRA